MISRCTNLCTVIALTHPPPGLSKVRHRYDGWQRRWQRIRKHGFPRPSAAFGASSPFVMTLPSTCYAPKIAAVTISASIRPSMPRRFNGHCRPDGSQTTGRVKAPCFLGSDQFCRIRRRSRPGKLGLQVVPRTGSSGALLKGAAICRIIRRFRFGNARPDMRRQSRNRTCARPAALPATQQSSPAPPPLRAGRAWHGQHAGHQDRCQPW